MAKGKEKGFMLKGVSAETKGEGKLKGGKSKGKIKKGTGKK